MPSTNDIAIEVHPAGNDKPGATASFPYDATLVTRFRAAFPRARWREDLRAWFVPGTTAARRLDRWLQRELSGALAHADERGRDAFSFDPIESRYLTATTDLQIRTPFSRTIIDELRAVPWAWWDGDQRLWRVPFRSLDELRRRWPAIEAAARRNEPDQRRMRREALRGTAQLDNARTVAGERRRRRYPVPADHLPPLTRPLLTKHGAMVFTDVTGELVDSESAGDRYPWVSDFGGDFIWASWRRPTLEELVHTWPARQPAGEAEIARGWWQPTLEELREVRRKVRSLERAQATRALRRAQ